MLTETWGENQFDTLVYRVAYACALHATGATAEAAQFMATAVADCERVLGNHHATTRQARQHLEQWQTVSKPE